MTLRCRKEHKAIFEEMGFNEEDEHDDGSIQMVDEQANYGHYSDLVDGDLEGIPFIASHSAGGEYGPSNYASDGEKVDSCSADHDGNEIVVVRSDGTIDPVNLENVRRFQSMEARALRMLGEEVKVETRSGLPVPGETGKRSRRKGRGVRG
jgi:hypothetical protein